MTEKAPFEVGELVCWKTNRSLVYEVAGVYQMLDSSSSHGNAVWVIDVAMGLNILAKRLDRLSAVERLAYLGRGDEVADG